MSTPTGQATHRGIVGSDPDAAGTAARVLHWRDESDTAAFARQLARSPALANAVITLHGDLGAGKTTLVRHLLRALGVQGRIKSPTYAVVEPHEGQLLGQPLQAWHLDCYRFGDPREWEDAGLRDLFASAGLKLVEWPQKAAGVLPRPDIDIALRPVPGAAGHGTDPAAAQDDAPTSAPHAASAGEPREVTLRAFTAAGATLLAAVAAVAADGAAVADPDIAEARRSLADMPTTHPCDPQRDAAS